MVTKGSRTWLGLGATALLVCCATALAAFTANIIWKAGYWWLAIVMLVPMVEGLLLRCLWPAVWLRPDLFNDALRKKHQPAIKLPWWP